MRSIHHTPLLIIEFLLLTLGMPLLLYWVLPLRYLLPMLWLTALYSYIVLRRRAPEVLAQCWKNNTLTAVNIRPILLRFLGYASLLTLLTLWLEPESLFGFVRENPGFWLLVMVAYPLFSVIPQEIIFRTFFFARYKPLFPNTGAMILASAFMFGFAHILFQNWVAPLLCVAGGVLFARTYAKHHSLWLVSLEHALYGDFIFTIGLGRYFYHGSVAAAL